MTPAGPAAGPRRRPPALDLQRLRDTLLPRLLVPAVPGAVGRGPARDADGRPLLYVTVDDGPDPDGTPRWIAGLGALGARAVFFLTAERAERRPDLVEALLGAGHRIASHGHTHADPWRRSGASTQADFARAERGLEALAGGPVRDVRPPYGRVTPALVRWARPSRRVVLWDLAVAADPQRDPRDVMDEIVELNDLRSSALVAGQELVVPAA